MAESERPRSPFAGKFDFSPRAAPRVLSLDEIGRILAAHLLYVETERRQGRRADFASADLSGMDFSALDLRRAHMAHAPRTTASLPRAHLARANHIGATLRQARAECARSSGPAAGHSKPPSA